MKSEDALSEPFVLNRANGTAVAFPRVTALDRITYRAEFLYHRKRQLAESLAILGITKLEALPLLNEMDARARKVRESHVIAWLDTPEGQRAAMLRILSDEQLDALDLTSREMQQAAAGVMGIELVPAGEGNDDPFVDGSLTATLLSKLAGLGRAAASATPSPSESTPSTDTPNIQ